MADPDDRKRVRDNLQGEVDGAALYQALADTESDPKLSGVYRRLSEIETSHGDFWRSKLGEDAGPVPKPSFRARTLARLARWFGPSFVLPTVADNEARDSAAYDNQSDAAAEGLPASERSHARLMRAAAGRGGLTGPIISSLEGRHRGGGGNALRAAVMGANDGLVSNLSLVMGVAGASGGGNAVLIAGLAGLVAGACSMAMGEWLSVTNARELAAKQIATEADELREVPDEEREELVLIYQAKGLDEPQARALADRLLSQPETALDTLTREELGLDPEDLGGSPWVAAGTSFVLFSIGAIFPIAPFFFFTGVLAVLASLAFSGIALAAIGAGTSLFTGRDVGFSALRQIAIGFLAAAFTYGVGYLFDVAVIG